MSRWRYGRRRYWDSPVVVSDPIVIQTPVPQPQPAPPMYPPPYGPSDDGMGMGNMRGMFFVAMAFMFIAIMYLIYTKKNSNT